MKKKKIIAFLLALIVIICGVIGVVYMVKYVKEKDTLTIVSFNIRAHNDFDENSIKERAPRLYQVVSKSNPDIIGFQEFSPNWEQYIEEYFSDTYDMFNKYRNEVTDIESAPILWRKDKFECADTGYFWLSDTPEEESRGWDEEYNCYRMCEYVILKELDTEKQFVVMNTHFGVGDDGQVKSAELIYEYSKKISDYPTIVLGDFNATPDMAAYKKMSALFTDVNAVTAKDWSQTYHGYDPEANADQHIDYCFVNDKVTPITQKILNELVEGKYPSDHYGLETKVKLND